MTTIADRPLLQPGEPTREEEPRRKRWTREEYYRMAELGLFEPGARVELIDGEILEMSPVGPRHATTVLRISRILDRALPPTHHVRSQSPVAFGDPSEPQPDIVVVEGTIEDFEEEHPDAAVLIVEVSDTTRRYDRGPRASLYASARVPEYWVVDLVDRVVEVRRDPVAVPEMPFGWGYQSVLRHQAGDRIATLLMPEVEFPVSELLPGSRAKRASRKKKP